MAGLDDYLINPNGNNAPAGTASSSNPQQMAVDPITTPNEGVGNTATQNGKSFLSNVKGPLGSSGILGAVLGTVQDAVLHDIGVGPQYWPRVAAARQADAISGWDQDPAGSYLKLAATAGVDAADTHLNSMLSGQYKQVETAKDQQQMQQAAAIAPSQKSEQLFKAQAPYYNLAASAKDPATAKAIGQNIRQAYIRNGWDQSDLPSDDSPEAWRQFAAAAIPAGQRYTADNTAAYRDARLDQIDKSLAISQQRADDANARAAASGARAEARESARDQRDSVMDPLREKLLGLQIQALGGKNAVQSQMSQAQINHLNAQSNKLNTAKDGTPLPGYRNPNGLVFQGGDPKNRASWK